jgi:CW-type Zinc Finger
MMDNHFNPTVASQCIARAHRMGQENPVYVYRLAIEGTMETKVYARGRNKTSVACAVIDGENIEASFTKDQLDDLYKVDCWATCCKCHQKRRLEGADPPDEDGNWCCEDNPDPDYNSCSKPLENNAPQSVEAFQNTNDAILGHLLTVVNKKTRMTALVTGCASVQGAEG